MARRPRKPDHDLSQELDFEEHAPQLRLLAPRLRPDTSIVPQTFHGRTFFVLQDPVTLQFYRVGETEREVLRHLDGRTTLGEVHERLKSALGSAAPPFRELAHFALMLRQANLTTVEGSDEGRWAVERAAKQRRRKFAQTLSNFLYITIPLFDPERFLSATVGGVRWLFSRGFFVVWLAVVGSALGAFFYHFDEMMAPANGVLAPENLFLLWIAFFAIKGLHEFGHAYAARHYGAEVHRMGVMFLVFMPVPYVDTTPVWAIPRKWPKVLVASAGMMVELFVAACAVWAWLALEPGTLRSVLYNLIFIASVSTVLFNGNPLLRYDAYYILADALEVPNLRRRSGEYLTYLLKRYLVGERVPPAGDTRREKALFVVYGVLSFVYRTAIVVGITLYIATRFFFLGVAIAVVTAALWLVVPVVKVIRYVFFARATRRVRLRAVAVFAVGTAAAVYLVGGVPLSAGVRAPCALEPFEEKIIRAEWPGFLTDVRIRDGDRVRQGDLLAQAVNDELDFQLERQRLRIRESESRLRLLETQDLAAAQAEAYLGLTLRKDLETLERRRASLTFRAPFDGQVIAPNLDRVRGRFLQLGEEVLRLASLDRLRVCAVVDDADIGAIRGLEGQPVRLKFRSDPTTVYLGTVERIHPSATTTPPTVTLTNAAGGPVLLDPKATDRQRTLLPWYRVDIDLDPGEARPPAGTTGTARFVLERQPLGRQAYTTLRRMLQRRFRI